MFAISFVFSQPRSTTRDHDCRPLPCLRLAVLRPHSVSHRTRSARAPLSMTTCYRSPRGPSSRSRPCVVRAPMVLRPPQGHCRTGGPRKSPSSVKSRDPRALGRSAMFLTEASLFPSRRWRCFCLHIPRLLVDFKFSRAKAVSRVSFGAWLLILHATGPQRASVH